MGKVMETPLDTATSEREKLIRQRQKILDEIGVMEVRYEELRSKLVSMRDDERREFASLKHEIPLQTEILAEVESQGKLLDSTIERLTLEKLREEAGAACLAVENEFRNLMSALVTDDLEAWLVEADRAHSLYYSANRGPSVYSGSNQPLKAKRAGVQDLVAMIKVLQTL